MQGLAMSIQYSPVTAGWVMHMSGAHERITTKYHDTTLPSLTYHELGIHMQRERYELGKGR